MALAAGAFDLNCALLLQGNGVLQLRTQHSQIIEQKNINKTLHALPMYDIDPIYVFEQDLKTFNIHENEIALGIKVLQKHEQADFINKAKKVIRL